VSSDQPLTAATPDLLIQTRQWVQAHRKGIIGALIVGMAGFGATAFGIAPMTPDPAQMPRHLVVTAIDALPAAPQLEALAANDLALTRSDITRSGDTADTLLRRLAIVDPEALAFLRDNANARQLFEGGGGKMVTAHRDANGQLMSLVARYSNGRDDRNFRRLTIERHGALAARVEEAPLEFGTRMASGTIRSSLFGATDESGIPDAVAVQMAEIFATDIDFRRELRKGDTFSLVYETLYADGEPVAWNTGTGRILAAEFRNGGRQHEAVWFPEGKGGYFDFDGESKRRAFLSSPLEFSRVSSGFAMRFHPIQKTWRRHLGVDYAATTGTPVRTVGDGIVTFAGRQNGYGNVIEIRHNEHRSTLYAHLSRIGVREGQRVEQGDFVGNVGSTGWATGPHLHFEVKVDGVQRDPLIAAKESEALRLDADQRKRFLADAVGLRAQLDVARDVAGLPGSVME